MSTKRRTLVAATDKGLVRRNNEDAYILLDANDRKTFVLILADGMGGHEKGEVASSIAVHYAAETLEDWLTPERTDQAILDMLGEIAERANVKVYLASMDKDETRSMGTTLTMAVIIRNVLLLSHVGDCRAYLLRKQRLHRLTRDHTLAQALYDAGSITEQELQTHRQRHVLTRALGVPEYMRADLVRMPIEPGDRFILSSDGLHGYVPDEEIREVMIRAQNPEIMVRSLIKLANRRGGQDNVTVMGGFL